MAAPRYTALRAALGANGSLYTALRAALGANGVIRAFRRRNKQEPLPSRSEGFSAGARLAFPIDPFMPSAAEGGVSRHAQRDTVMHGGPSIHRASRGTRGERELIHRASRDRNSAVKGKRV